jgi:hypothetical protein
VIACEQGGSCADANFGCPPDTSCELACTAPAACDGATLFCDGGVCSLSCLGQEGPCSNVTVECGDNHCQATCDFTFELPTLDCAEACDCTKCDYAQGGG